jgi:hypothetical protein
MDCVAGFGRESDMQTKRIYMTEADASPGNGAPAAPPVPAEPPAAPAAPAPVGVTVDQVKNLMTEMLAGFKNATFAELRKAGALGKDKSSAESTNPSPSVSPTAAAPAPSGLTEAVLEARLEQERVITRVQVENKLTDAQVKRMKTALKVEQPEDAASWASAYLTDLGLVRQAETAPTQVTPITQPQPNGQPISDKGAPSPGGVVNWEREFAENPIGMSPAARGAMDAKHGAEKARKMRLEAAQVQAARIKVTTR